MGAKSALKPCWGVGI